MTTDPGWFGDPNITHEPGAEPAPDGGWRPVCSCGFRAPLTHNTEERARRGAARHAAVSAPMPPGRYSAELDADGATVHIRCAQHPDEPLASFPDGVRGRGGELVELLAEHDRQQHGGHDDD